MTRGGTFRDACQIGNIHWASATVSFLSSTVTLFDSLGGLSALKSLICSRLLLFARQAELRRRVLFPGSAAEETRWTVDDEVNEPAQRDGYNCGLFAFAYIWCSVCGVDFVSLHVVGDAVRLFLLHYVLMSGRECTAQQALGQRVAG